MSRLSKSDLEQMGESYFESLEPERLVEVAKNLYKLAVEQLEEPQFWNLERSSSPQPETTSTAIERPKPLSTVCAETLNNAKPDAIA